MTEMAAFIRPSTPRSQATRHAPMPRSAMVFAAGLGKRMRPVTNKLPKPLVKVGGKALIDHTLDAFAAAGVERAVVNVHYFPQMMIEHLRGRISPHVVISDESAALLDQGGGVRKALDMLGDEPFFIGNTDSFWIGDNGSNLRRLAAAWDPERMDILLLVAPTTASVGVDWKGDFFMAADGVLLRRPEQLVAPFVYAGVGIMKPEPFRTEARAAFPLAPLFTGAAEQRRLFGVRLDGIWLHVGTPEAILDAERALARAAI